MVNVLIALIVPHGSKKYQPRILTTLVREPMHARYQIDSYLRNRYEG